MTTHSNVLAWRIIWTEKPGRLQSMGSHKIGHDWSNLVVVVVYCDKLPSYPNFDFELFCTWIVTAATAHFCSQLRDVLKVLVTQSCQTLCNPMDCSPPGSPVHRILQARILERLPFPSPGDLPHPGIKPTSPVSQADSLPSEPPGKLVRDILGCLIIKHIFLHIFTFFDQKFRGENSTAALVKCLGRAMSVT